MRARVRSDVDLLADALGARPTDGRLAEVLEEATAAVDGAALVAELIEGEVVPGRAALLQASPAIRSILRLAGRRLRAVADALHERENEKP